jgi:hypothetical protein
MEFNRADIADWATVFRYQLCKKPKPKSLLIINKRPRNSYKAKFYMWLIYLRYGPLLDFKSPIRRISEVARVASVRDSTARTFFRRFSLNGYQALQDSRKYNQQQRVKLTASIKQYLRDP